MHNKSILIISDKLIQKIDSNWGNLSRAEFIDFCIKTMLGSEESKAKVKETPKYIAREEFEEFKASIIQLQKTFIDFLINYGLKPRLSTDEQHFMEEKLVELERGNMSRRMFIIPDELMEKINRHRGEMSPAEFVNYCIDYFLKGQSHDQDSKLEELKQPKPLATKSEAQPEKAFSWLWLPALLFFGFGDTLTSYLVFAAGGTEANPFLAALMHLLGGGIISSVVVKTIILVALVFLAYGLKKHGWVIPVVLTILGGYLVGHNILSLSRLM